MTQIKLKKFYFLVEPKDVKSSRIDVYGIIEEKGKEIPFSVEVATPDYFLNQMERTKKKFVLPNYPSIIVSEITSSIVNKALKRFLNESEDGFWLKFYNLTDELTMSDLNNLLKRREKEQAQDLADESDNQNK